MSSQQRINSPVVKTSIVLVLAFLIKYFWKIEIEDKTVEAMVVVFGVIYHLFATWNNPRDPKNL